MEPPVDSEWSRQALTPWPVRMAQQMWAELTETQHADMRRAFYAQCTHIDHQLRLLIGALREEGILDNTLILFTSDHGDMLGDHGLYAKRFLYQGSVRIPMLLVTPVGRDEIRRGTVDNRLVALQDIMPTLLSLCDIPVPESCDGLPMVGARKRQMLYCESMEGPRASRMVTNGRYKLFWYPAGNRFQLFDLFTDPAEQHDVFYMPEMLPVIKLLRTQLMAELYGDDLQWLVDGTFVGCDEPEITRPVNRDLGGQRGIHFPPLATATDPGRVVGFG